MSEKPLHVRVAEALGWSRIEPKVGRYYNTAPDPCGCWAGVMPDEDGHGWSVHIPHFDTDWSATGPLIERYQLQMSTIIVRGNDLWEVRQHKPNDYESGDGKTPLLAVCDFILECRSTGRNPSLVKRLIDGRLRTAEDD